MTKPLKADTLRRLEKAAMRMVDRNGWLITRDDCKTYEKRRDEFEDAVSDHVAVWKKRK